MKEYLNFPWKRKCVGSSKRTTRPFWIKNDTNWRCKVIPVQTMKAYMGKRGIVPLILNICTRLMSVRWWKCQSKQNADHNGDIVGDETWVKNNLICIKCWQDGDVMGIRKTANFITCQGHQWLTYRWQINICRVLQQGIIMAKCTVTILKTAVYTLYPNVVPALDTTPHHCIQNDKTLTLYIQNTISIISFWQEENFVRPLAHC